jgi:hypothetical protein
VTSVCVVFSHVGYVRGLDAPISIMSVYVRLANVRASPAVRPKSMTQTVCFDPVASSDSHNLGRGSRQSDQFGQHDRTHLIHRSHMLLDLLWLYGHMATPQPHVAKPKPHKIVTIN